MKNILLSLLVAIAGITAPVLAEDEPLCLECHEPAEDWEGMTRAEVLATAMDPSIKRHKDHQELCEEELKKIIDMIMPKVE